MNVFGKARVLAVALAAVAAGAGVMPTSAAAAQYLNLVTQGCVATTSTSGSTVIVTMTCAASASTNAAPTSTSEGVLQYTVSWSAGGFPCPSDNSPVVVTYQDAYGSVMISGSTETWRNDGNDAVTGAALCHMWTNVGPTSGWSVSGKNSYSGMSNTSTTSPAFYAMVPGLSLPVSENQTTQAAVAVNVSNQ